MTKFNCQTLPNELRSKQNAKWTPHGAIAELVDNSFGPMRGNANKVIISFDPKARTIEVLDDGQGMDHIGRLFQGGNSIGRAVGDIGEYGAGGSLAVLWLATKVETWTMRGDGRVMFDSVVWKEWIAAPSFKNLGVSDDWAPANASNTPAELLAIGHGTLIRMHLMPKRKIDGAKIRHELARLYSPGLRNGKKICWLTVRKNEVIDTLALTDAFIAPSAQAESIAFDLVIDHEDDGVTLTAKGRVFYDERTSQADSRMQIGYGHRIIRSATECFQSEDGSEKYSGVGVSGWLDLGDSWRGYLTTTKDGIDDEILFDTLMAYVFEKIKPLLKKSQQKIFAMQFEDLALGLERALNQRTGGNITVHVQTPGFPDVDSRGGLIEDGPERMAKDDPPGTTERHAPPRLTIQLSPLNDVQMKGHLCRSDIRDSEITIYINQEHRVIEEALKAKPVNKMLLNTVVVSELASELALEQYEPFVGKLFRPQAARLINDIEDHRDKARTLTRELIDRVRTAPVAEAPPDAA